MKKLLWLALALAWCACGPGGTVSGTVDVVGGSAAGVAVILYGPVSAATVTAADGSFGFEKLPDGDYAVRAHVSGSVEGDQTASTTVTGGAQAGALTLHFDVSTATVTGHVRFTDDSSPDSLTVTASGAVTRAVRTMADGSFSFEGLPQGAYLVSFEAPGTREGRAAMSVTASGTVDVGTLTLTPVGTVTGVVNAQSGMPAANVTVDVAGADVRATTDADGHFMLRDVPTGTATVRARVGVDPFFRSATTQVQLTRGATVDVTLGLTDEQPRLGTVSGTVVFYGPRLPRDLSISVPGTSVTGAPGLGGSFSLNVPVGSWDVVASAPYYPRTVLGHVEVTEGNTVTLPPRTVTWLRPVLTDVQGGFSSLGVFSPGHKMPWVLAVLTDSQTQRLVLFNTDTAETRVVHVGQASELALSSKGRYAAWSVGTVAFLYDVSSGALSSFSGARPVVGLDFSSDEKVLWVNRQSVELHRISTQAPAVDDVFPSSGLATSLAQQNADRWFVIRGAAADLVTPTREVSSIITNIALFGVAPTFWAAADCTPTCHLHLVAPDLETETVDNTVVFAAGALNPFLGGTLTSTARYPCFWVSATTNTAFCVDSEDGTHYPLPALPQRFQVNADGTRVIHTYNLSGNRVVREEPLPPLSTTANAASSTDNFNVGWLSADRAFATTATTSVDVATSILLFKAGVGSSVDAVTQLYASPPLLVFTTQGGSTWSALLGDANPRDLGVDATRSPLALVARRSYDPVTRYGAVAFDSGLSSVVDEVAGAVRPLPDEVPGTGERSGALEYFVFQRPNSGAQGVYLLQQQQELEIADVFTSAWVGTPGFSRALLGLNADRTALVAGLLVP